MSGIEQLPEGMEMLKFLDLSGTNIEEFPQRILVKYPCLQTLKLQIYGVQVKAEELHPLKNLTGSLIGMS